MAYRLAIFTIFVLLSITFALSMKNPGNSKKKKINRPKLSDNIDNNPFLQKDNITAPTNYQGNPFLSNLLKSQLSSPNKGSEENKYEYEYSSVNFTATETNYINIAVHIHNPFLQPEFAINYTSNTTPLNNSDVNVLLPNKVFVNETTSEINTHIDTRTKSEIKCEEYGRQFWGTTEVLSLVGTNPETIKITNKKCMNANRLVVGGVDASRGEFPHMVALGTKTTEGAFSFTCGGSLIAPEWVLTAAHCTYGPKKSPTDVRIGFHNLQDNNDGITATINKIMRHPSYKPPAMYADIALIKLNTAITFNKEIRPACLYQLYDTVPTQAWVTGWGVTKFGENEQSDQLQKALLDIVDNIGCAIRHNQSIAVPYGITPSMICAGDPRGGWNKDTCQGDSGGPLQIIHPQNLCLFQVIGITSFGQGCAVIDTPGVYTRVSHYLNWIEDTVWS